MTKTMNKTQAQAAKKLRTWNLMWKTAWLLIGSHHSVDCWRIADGRPEDVRAGSLVNGQG